MPSHDKIRELLMSANTVELLAAIEHERWAHWQQYLHSQCVRQEDGSLTIPVELVSRWQAQINAPYAELSEREKSSDREQVCRYLDVLVEILN
jgi:hypothetical protein